MATVINNPSEDHTHSSDSSAWVIGIVLLVVLAIFLIFGYPALRGGGANIPNTIPQQPSQQTQEQAPQSDSDSGINIDVPEKVDVNVNPPQDQSQQ